MAPRANNGKKSKTSKKKVLAVGLPVLGAVALPTVALAQGGDEATASEEAATHPAETESQSDTAARDAYWAAGYNYGQLLALAEQWNTDEFSAKVTAGNMILDNNTTEIDAIVTGVADIADPFPATDAAVAGNEGAELEDKDTPAMAAYWEAGYNYGQLLALAEEWNTDEFSAKVTAGNMILEGNTTTIDDLVGDVPDVEFEE